MRVTDRDANMLEKHGFIIAFEGYTDRVARSCIKRCVALTDGKLLVAYSEEHQRFVYSLFDVTKIEYPKPIDSGPIWLYVSNFYDSGSRGRYRTPVRKGAR